MSRKNFSRLPLDNSPKVCYIVAMKLIEKPDVKNWPDDLKLVVRGVPILIDYKAEQILVPSEAQHLQEGLSHYLIDEGFVVVNEGIEL